MVYRVEWCDGFPDVDAWNALARRSLAPNVFHEPAFALAARDVLGRGVGALCVCDPAGELVGVFLGRLTRRRFTAWTHAYGPVSTPLVDEGCAQAVIRAVLEWLGSRVWFVDFACHMPTGAFGQQLGEVLRPQALAHHVSEGYRRVLVFRGTAEASLHEKKPLAKRWRQYERQGELRFVTYQEDMERGLEIFFALEAKGWKGQRGTAASLHSEIRELFAAALGALSRVGGGSVEVLTYREVPIAALIFLRSGGTGWFWKVAYDEAHAPLSPGIQLMMHVTRLCEERGLELVDSCTIQSEPYYQAIWPNSIPCGRLVISFAPAWRFRLDIWRRQVWFTAKTWGKAWAKRLKRRIRA